MAQWNLKSLNGVRYPAALTQQQRDDLLLVVLGANRLSAVDADMVDEALDRQGPDVSPDSEKWQESVIVFCHAAWRVLGDTEHGMVDLKNWLPLAENATEVIYGMGLGEAGSTPVTRLFASLISTAQNPKSEFEIPDLDPAVFEYSVPAAVIFAGAALQFVAARHPHAPRVKPGATGLPPKVIAFAGELAHGIDSLLAEG